MADHDEPMTENDRKYGAAAEAVKATADTAAADEGNGLEDEPAEPTTLEELRALVPDNCPEAIFLDALIDTRNRLAKLEMQLRHTL